MALRKEGVALSGRLRAGHQLHEELRLDLDALVERQAGSLKAADVVFRSQEASGLAGDLRAEVGEHLRVDAGDLIVAVAHLHQRERLGDGSFGKDHGGLQIIPLPIDDLVDQAIGRGFGSGHVSTGCHCVERLGHADQTRQPLGPTGTRQQTDVDLGQAVLDDTRPTR